MLSYHKERSQRVGICNDAARTWLSVFVAAVCCFGTQCCARETSPLARLFHWPQSLSRALSTYIRCQRRRQDLVGGGNLTLTLTKSASKCTTLRLHSDQLWAATLWHFPSLTSPSWLTKLNENTLSVTQKYYVNLTCTRRIHYSKQETTRGPMLEFVRL